MGPARGPEDFLLGRHVRRNPPDLRGCWLNQKATSVDKTSQSRLDLYFW